MRAGTATSAVPAALAPARAKERNMTTKTKDLQKFTKEYSKKSTRECYTSGLTAFLKTVYPNEEKNAASIRYLHEVTEEGRDYIHDLREAGDVFSKKYAPGTTRKYIKTVLLWLNMNEINTDLWEKRLIFAKIPTGRPITSEYELKRKMIRDVWETMPEWGKVVTLVLAGSGMRIGETMQLKKEDIDFSKKPAIVRIKAEYTKGRMPRITMLTAEAEAALKEYLESRTDNDPRVFPHTQKTYRYYWNQGIEARGYSDCDPFTGRRMFHIHMLRKWFISRFSLAASKDVAEYLAGHMGYLSISYTRFTHKQIRKQFLKAEKKISILKFDCCSGEPTPEQQKIVCVCGN